MCFCCSFVIVILLYEDMLEASSTNYSITLAQKKIQIKLCKILAILVFVSLELFIMRLKSVTEPRCFFFFSLCQTVTM